MYTDLKVVHFNPRKREFSLLINIPRALHSVMRYNSREQLRVQTLTFCSTLGQGREGRRSGTRKEMTCKGTGGSLSRVLLRLENAIATRNGENLGAFLWDDLDKDQRILVDQMNQ